MIYQYDKHALLYLFDTCNLNCGYCNLVEDGYVKDLSQLKKYEDKRIIDHLVAFFKKNKDTKWRVSLTGGEPTMMPNFEYFVNQITSKNLKISMYTNLTLHHESQIFKFIQANANNFYVIFATLHNEYFEQEDYFFEKVRLLKEAGVPIIVKSILMPQSLHLLERFDSKCKELNIGFMPMALLTEHYPKNYTELEKDHMKRYMTTFKQVVHLHGGLDVKDARCNAGQKVINIDARSGDIYPCADIYPPYKPMGNINDESFEFYTQPSCCLKEEKICLCDLHYEHAIIEGIEENIDALISGYVASISVSEVEDIIHRHKLKMQNSNQINVRKDSVQNYAGESKNLRELKKIAKDREDMIKYLHEENEKKAKLIEECRKRNKGLRWLKKLF